MTVERRTDGFIGATARAWWEVRFGPWGLLLILAVHQAVVAVLLGIDAYIIQSDTAISVPGGRMWPIVFALGALGAGDIYRYRWRSRVDLAQALMLLAYGSRAMAIILGAVLDGWNRSAAIGAVTWVALMFATQRAWSEARGEL